MTTFTETGREGALRAFEITGASNDQYKTIKSVCEYGAWFKDGVITGSTNKSNFETVKNTVNGMNIAPRVATSKTGRYVDLESNANGKNHGKTWIASGRDIDTKQLHPSWEGQSICYIYG